MNECIMNWGAINWLAVIVATVAGYLLGAIWYSNALFGNAWQKIQGLNEEDLKKGFAPAMIITFITTFLTAFVVAAFIVSLQASKINHYVLLSILIGVFLVGGNMLSENLYSRRPWKFWWITAGYRFFMILIMAIIIGMWQ